MASVDNWLGRLAPKTARDYRFVFQGWMRWLQQNGEGFAQMTPDQLVEYQQNTDNSHKYQVLDFIQRYVLGLKGRASSKTRTYAVLRSFFSHNRVELPKDTTFTIRSEIPPVQGTLTLDELKNGILSSSPVYRAIFTSMFQGGMGVAEFYSWNLNGWESLKNQLMKDPEIVKIELPGRKMNRNKRPFFTFVGGDAINAIRDWIPSRPKNAKAIFTNQYGAPIRPNAVKLYWKRHLSKLGLVKPKKNGHSGNRYGKNIHEIRDLFRSQWEKSPVKGSIAEFLMGHVVDPLEYNKAFRDESWVRSEYDNALPYLQIMSSSVPYNLVDGDELTKLRKKIACLENEKKEDIEELRTQLEEVKALLSDLKEMKKLVDELDEPEEEDQHQIVESEAEMLRLLNDGWTLVQPLNGNKYLLKK